MSPLAPAAALGFLVGLRHAMEADHVAAVGAIVARERNLRGAALIGAAWGLGHTLSLLALGGAIVAFGLVVPRRVSLLLELGVGVMLFGLGIWNLVSRGDHRHSHLAASPSAERPSVSSSEAPGHESHGFRSSLRRAWRPLVVGGMHGLAGSAAAALLVVATVESASWGLAYLLVLGIGTMLGMVALTTALALPMGRALQRFRHAGAVVRIASGALSFVVGVLVVYQIGFRDGLFWQ